CKRRCEASPPDKVYGDYKPTIKNKDTGKDEVIPYEKFKESHKKMIFENNEAKMVLYNALPKKEYERIFMCKTAKDVWNSLIITHQGNKQVKDNKIDLFVQKYKEFVISDDETIDCAFARFNTIITSLKALDESFSSRNHGRNFLRDIPTKWRLKGTAIEESKDLSTLPLDELIGNLKVYEVVLEKDLEASKIKKEKYKSLALKARKISSDEEESCSGSDEEYAMAVRDFKKFFRSRGKFVCQPYNDKKNIRKVKEEMKGKEERRCFKCGNPNHIISDCPKYFFDDQKAFVGGCWSDSEDGDESKDEICLMALENNELLSDSLYYSSSSLDSESLQNEYNKLCKISLRIINKNKLLKAKNEILDNEIVSLSLKLARFENSIHFLQEMIENQRTQKDKKGLGFTKDIVSTSKTKTKELGQVDDKTPTVEPAELVPSTREPASSIVGNRPSAESIRVICFSIYNDDGNPSSVIIKQHCSRSYALRWKYCQGGSSKLNLPDHRLVISEPECCSLILAKSDSLSHAHTQALKVNHSASRLLLLNKNVISQKVQVHAKFSNSANHELPHHQRSSKSNQESSSGKIIS
ncbi:zf-CCHC domain-containing protein, partial [Tanacetum coccineum]